MESDSICPICLRNNVRLKAIPATLSEYHNELICYTLPLNNFHYCSICECLLRKTYNFQKRCAAAATILKNCMSTTIQDRAPTNMLHLKLPPISLAKWTNKNSRVFNYTGAYNVDEPIVIEDCDSADEAIVIRDCVSAKPDPKNSMVQNSSEKPRKNEGTENTKGQDEKVFKTKLDYEMTDIDKTNTSLQKLRKSFIHIENNIHNDLIKKPINTDDYITNGIPGVNNMESIIVETSSKKIMDIKNQSRGTNKVVVQGKDGKRYIELDVDDIEYYTKYTNNAKNDMPKLRHEKPKQNDDVSKKENNLDPANSLTDTASECTENNDMEPIYFSDNDNEDDTYLIVIEDKNEYVGPSLYSDDDYLCSPPKKTKTEQETHIVHSGADVGVDCEFDINKPTTVPGKTIFHIQLMSKEQNIISKLQSMDNTLDSICDNWEVIPLLIDMNIGRVKTKNEIKKMTETFLTAKRTRNPVWSNYKKISVLSKMEHMCAVLDSIYEMGAKTVTDWKLKDDVLRDPKERLKWTLNSWGPLKAEKGMKFDKDIIISRLDTISTTVAERLLILMHGKQYLCTAAKRILKMIQDNRQQLSIKYESVFDIEYLLTESDKFEEFERRKTYTCYVETEYKCDICYQGFKRKGYLEYHQKLHNNQLQFSCRICNVRYGTRKGLNKHMLYHTVVYKCKLCPLVTYYKDSMINHYEQHKGTIYECATCGNKYKSKSVLTFHQNKAHPQGDHVCIICGGSYFSKHGLNQHINMKHKGKPPPAPEEGSDFTCENCRLTFLSREAYFRHRRVTHRERISTRTRWHTGPRGKPNKKPLMVCPECKAVGHSPGWMMKHFGMEHPSLDVAMAFAHKHKFLCEICGKRFTHRHSFADHTNIHSGVTFPCPTCNKRFSTKLKLRHHSLFHGPPNYRCERCDKKFYSSSNLYLHMRTHIGDRCFKCHICARGFLHRFSLKEHIRGVHNHERRRRKKPVAADGKKQGATDA